jgi:hypothetical protein
MKYLQTKTGPQVPHLVKAGVKDDRSWETLETIDETSCGIPKYESFLESYRSKCKNCPEPLEHYLYVRILDDPIRMVENFNQN